MMRFSIQDRRRELPRALVRSGRLPCGTPRHAAMLSHPARRSPWSQPLQVDFHVRREGVVRSARLAVASNACPTHIQQRQRSSRLPPTSRVGTRLRLNDLTAHRLLRCAIAPIGERPVYRIHLIPQTRAFIDTRSPKRRKPTISVANPPANAAGDPLRHMTALFQHRHAAQNGRCVNARKAVTA